LIEGGTVARFPVNRRSRDQRGAVAVEFALIMPFLCLLVFGIIEFGYIINRDMIVGNASRDGARAASLGDIKADICTSIKAELTASGIPVPNSSTPTNCAVQASSPTTITITCRKPDNSVCSTAYDTEAISGSTAIIDVRYRHTLVTPFISSVIGNVVTLSQSTQMRVE
jgi:Flp pilus assembly protein TadG